MKIQSGKNVENTLNFVSKARFYSFKLLLNQQQNLKIAPKVRLEIDFENGTIFIFEVQFYSFKTVVKMATSFKNCPKSQIGIEV